ncbi:MAG: NUDIX domain-containing protein [Bdellovibrionia bacterium]
MPIKKKSAQPKSPSSTLQKKVQVWIYFQNPTTRVYSFLLLKTTPERGGFWQPVTGGVKKRESLANAALREAVEESGLEFHCVPEPIEYGFEYEKKGAKYLEYGFAMSLGPISGQPPQVSLSKQEHTEYEWVTAKEACARLHFPSNVTMLKTFLSKLFRAPVVMSLS